MKNLDREEFQLVYDALKNYSVYMDSDQKKLSEQILDFLYYPRLVEDREENDKTGEEFREENTDWQSDDVFDDIVKDAEEALANEPEINGIKSLNFR